MLLIVGSFDSFGGPIENAERHAEVMRRLQAGRLDRSGRVRRWVEVCPRLAGLRMSSPAALPARVPARFQIVDRVVPAVEPPDVEADRVDRCRIPVGVELESEPTVPGGSASEGAVTIRWFTGESTDDIPECSFHYTDETGFDCGWHHASNPHVEDRSPYQERQSAEAAYEYQSVSFESTQPVRVTWEILERLEAVL